MQKTELLSSDRQYGFRPNTGTNYTIDTSIFIVRLLMRKFIERSINRHYHFVNFKSSFKTIWKKTWNMMRPIGMCNKIIIEKINIIEKMTKQQVVVDGLLAESFSSVSARVRQDCLLSATLFKPFLDFTMDELKCLQEHYRNTTLDYELNFDVRYENDTTLIAMVFEKL